MYNLIIKANPRKPDAYGSGHFGASRGSRIHKGIDFDCAAGSSICSTVDGIVTKHGYPYGDDLSFRYVQVTCKDTGHKHRFFYVLPCLEVGTCVSEGDIIGTSQTLQDKYPKGMTDHVHFEIMTGIKQYKDPGEFLG